MVTNLALVTSVLFLIWAYNVDSSSSAHSLWSSKLSTKEIDVIWKYRRGEINGGTAANAVAYFNPFYSIMAGLGLASAGAVPLLNQGVIGIRTCLCLLLAGSIIGLFDPLGAAGDALRQGLGDWTSQDYIEMTNFFYGNPDEAVKRSYEFFGGNGGESVDELNRILMNSRVKLCQMEYDWSQCRLTELHFEMIRADRFQFNKD